MQTSCSAERGYELPSSDADCHLPVPNGIKLLQCGEGYHDPIGRSVTDLTVVRRRKGSLFFCGAKLRDWPLNDGTHFGG